MVTGIRGGVRTGVGDWVGGVPLGVKFPRQYIVKLILPSNMKNTPRHLHYIFMFHMYSVSNFDLYFSDFVIFA